MRTFCIRSVAFSAIILVFFLFNFLYMHSSFQISFLYSLPVATSFPSSVPPANIILCSNSPRQTWRFPPHSPLNLTIPYGTVKHPPSQTPPVVPGVSDWISPSLQTYRPSSATNCRIPRCHPVSTSCLNPYNNYYSVDPHLTPKPSRNIVVRELTHIYNSPSADNTVVHRLMKEDTKFLFYCNDKGKIKGLTKLYGAL